ncbi:hypothetical protein VE00_06388 [Pseudogymnoascus sp. WSF 3629]|nr:hypothetical protein VE00_06388 [Pseudogymnoascus sp. WSF 3629]
MEDTSKKRKGTNMTISEQNAKNEKDAEDDLEVAKGNRLDLRNEAEKRKRLYTTLKGEVAEFLEETGEEPTNIAKERDAAKKAVNGIKTELNEAEETYSKAVENYKKARENNGADDLAVEVQWESLRDDLDIAEGNLAILREYLAETKTVHGNLAARYKAEKTPELKSEVKIQQKRIEITKEDIQKAKNEIREIKISQNNGELPDKSDDEDADENLGDDGLFVNNEKDAKDDLEVAKGNRLDLRNEAEKRKRLYTTLKGEVAEFLEETGKEPTNIAKERDAAKKAVKAIKTELNEAEEKYSTAVKNYKKARENNGAVDLAVEVQEERLQDDLDIAEGNLAILREYLAETKTVHGNLAARYKAEKTPELKTEVKIQKKRLEVTKEDIEKAKNEIRDLKMKRNDGEMPDRSDDEDADENLDNDGLFVSEDEGEEDIDPEDIWSPALARKRAGLGRDVFRIEGFRDGRPAKVITGRGPPNASSFRLENESDYAVDRETDIDITKNRKGDEKIGGKWQFGKQNLPVIQGIALPPGGSVESVMPIPKVPYGTFQQRATPTAIKVKWWLGDNSYAKCWETRSTIRRVFGRVQGDIAIYEAAKFQEKRYGEWLSGHRGNTGRSPSAQPRSSQVHFDISDDDSDDDSNDDSDDDSDGDNDDKPQKVGKTKKKQGEPKIKKEPGEEEPTGTAQKPAETAMNAMQIFEARWCKRNNIDPAKMSMEDDYQFTKDWEAILKAEAGRR